MRVSQGQTRTNNTWGRAPERRGTTTWGRRLSNTWGRR
jgi:hypothetical protein